ncbi:3'-5' exonuclease [Diabrotica virgifera virgifera]|uniref:3'-5' exonuclease n=1 Tax=Diabrotica virgifera virgifera TaxID=50390 RepID=A0ABM5KT15_DIAVI|nr:3'-5' exonuclease [Diabrotica virgifera virgifera]
MNLRRSRRRSPEAEEKVEAKIMKLEMTLRPRPSPEEKAEAKRIAEYRANNPFIEFKGKITYHTELIDIALVSDNLLERAKVVSDLLIIGFDMEWPFNFQTGPGKTATIQISYDEEHCYIFHVSKIRNLPSSLSQLLIHPNVRLTGNCIKRDVRKLARDFAGFDGDKMVDNCVDLGLFANRVLSIRDRWSLERLVEHFLDLQISKDKKVRHSRWHIIPLSKEQQLYAATDSYASLLLYNVLKSRENDLKALEN